MPCGHYGSGSSLADWFSLGERGGASRWRSRDMLLMRRDPPFDMDYVHLTYALELAERAGTLVINRPQALRDANEKFFITHFPAVLHAVRHCAQAPAFGRLSPRPPAPCVVKPLDGMGGESIFQLNPGDPNRKVILEAITRHDQELVMVQQYIPEITAGDKRILLGEW